MAIQFFKFLIPNGKKFAYSIVQDGQPNGPVAVLNWQQALQELDNLRHYQFGIGVRVFRAPLTKTGVWKLYSHAYPAVAYNKLFASIY